MAAGQVNKNDIALLFRTKRGLHQFLTVEANYFLPAEGLTSMTWLREIWTGRKRVSPSHLT